MDTRSTRVVIVARSQEDARRYAKREGILLQPTFARRWAICVSRPSDVDKIGTGRLSEDEVIWVKPENIGRALTLTMQSRLKAPR
jgi:hypothetical protein